MIDPETLRHAIANTRAHLLSQRNAAGHWEGELSTSALSTATAVVALSKVDAREHAAAIQGGVQWLVNNQNADGGWGDTTISKSNLSTTLLCWSAIQLDDDPDLKSREQLPSHSDPESRKQLVGVADPEGRENLAGGAGSEATGTTGPRPSQVSAPEVREKLPPSPLGLAIQKADAWILANVGSLDPSAITKAVIARYGKDKTFSVPILMLCAICGTLGDHDTAWKCVLPLPFELAAMPREWFGAIGLPVVSYALPALIAIGYARHYHQPLAWWNPLRWLRASLWGRIAPMLKTLQPSTGGYLEATPLTSFVTMALASADEKHHPCVAAAVEFILNSRRPDGSWPIDTNLATWGTTLSTKALLGSSPVRSSSFSLSESNRSEEGVGKLKLELPTRESHAVREWLLAQQYRVVHPFTNAAPGGWAWTDLPGGVPDADDTSGAIVALHHLSPAPEERVAILPQIEAGLKWLLDLQNRDGGVPTFCRGWGTLPFDRSTPEITAHVLWAAACWQAEVSPALRSRLHAAQTRALGYLERKQFENGSWHPLWFGNENTSDEENPVHGTAMVLLGVTHVSLHTPETQNMLLRAVEFLLSAQRPDGGWGGAASIQGSLEETANAMNAICHWVLRNESSSLASKIQVAIAGGAAWLVQHTAQGAKFQGAPIGLYFARLWYHERLYPIIWTLGALQKAEMVLKLSRSTAA